MTITSKHKIYISFIFSLLSTVICFGQQDTATHYRKWHFGIRTGINLSTVSGNFNDDKPSWKPSFHTGGIVNFDFNNSFSLQTELLFSSKGYVSKSGFVLTNTPGTITTTYNATDKLILRYFEIPIMLNYKTKSGLFFSAGPYIDLLQSLTYKYEFTITTVGSNPPTSASDSGTSADKDGYNKFDAGVCFSAGYQTQSPLGFSVEFDKGFMNIYSDLLKEKHNNVNLKLSVKYLFRK